MVMIIIQFKIIREKNEKRLMGFPGPDYPPRFEDSQSLNWGPRTEAPFLVPSRLSTKKNPSISRMLAFWAPLNCLSATGVIQWMQWNEKIP